MHVIHNTVSWETYTFCHLVLALLNFTSRHHMNVVFSAVLHVGILVLAYLGAHKSRVTLGDDRGSTVYHREEKQK